MSARAPGPRFAVYASTAGNYFYAEIRHLLACGLREAGFQALEADERKGFIPRADWHVVAAPHEFFYLGAGRALRAKPWPPGVILYNAEQPQSRWFSEFYRLLPRAHAVWDMDLETCGRLAREGWRCSRLPLGWVKGCELFSPVPRLPRISMTRALPAAVRDFPAGRAGFSRRPLDLLFIGGRVPRRTAWFQAAASLLSSYRGFYRLVDFHRFLRPGAMEPLHTRTFLGLAQRAKLVLNIHLEEARYFEWHRIAVHGIGQGALVLSEPTTEAPPFKAGRDFVSAPLRDFPEAIRHYLGSPRGLAEGARIAARGLRTYRESCRLAAFLPAALAGLRSPGTPMARRARRREAAAAALLRASP